MPSEAWALAPCEVSWWLQVRGVAKVEDGFEFGRMIALGFNNPRILSREMREWYDRKRLQAASAKGGIEAVAEMFRMAGVQVIDRTSETGS